MHCVARQNKLETPRDKDEVNKREIRECDGRAHDPDTMVAPLTPKPTRKAEALTRVTPTIVPSHEEDAALKEVSLSRYRCANCILEFVYLQLNKKGVPLESSPLFFFFQNHLNLGEKKSMVKRS